MNRRTLLYIPLVLLFVLSAFVYYQHARPTVRALDRLIDQSHSIRFPFAIKDGKISDVLPEAAAAGMRPGDVLVGMGGRLLPADVHLPEEIDKFRIGEKIVYTVDRANEIGGTDRLDLPVEAVQLSMSFRQTLSDVLITFLFQLCLPAISYLLGFYVAFLRPRDPNAWILLALLLGIGSIAIEGGPEGSFVRTFQETAMNFLGISMLLFGIYFPERLDFDRRYPWAKFILIVPLGLYGLLDFCEQTGRFFSVEAIWRPIDDLTKPYDSIATILSMVAFGGFFAAMSTKSATTENLDSRRRLRILYVGCSIAMTPALIIIIYRIASGKQGGFLQLVPEWFAIFALLAILLFPLTMAYVIVVQRAMDVSVFIRQGIQYALATNGVRVLQFVFLLVVILMTVLVVRNFGDNLLAQVGFVAGGIALIPLIGLVARHLRVWIDRRFFREAYNAEQILADLSDDVRTMVETKPLLETVAARISESLHVPQVTLLLRNGANFVPAYSLGYDTPPVACLSDDSRTMRKLRSNRHIVLYDDMTEVTSVPVISLNEREQLAELNTQILLPLAVKDELSGIISLSPKLSEEPYTATDLRLLKSVAGQTGLALENSRLSEALARDAAQKERLNTEIDIAREVQERLFPQELPKVDGLDYFGACRPALGVGGDYYDFLELPGGKLGIAIGDISGKGIGASLMMASLQASLRGQSIHFGDDLAGLMMQINGLLFEASTTNRYATFFYAQYDPATRKLAYVNAGHNPPFLIRASGEVVLLTDGGPVVGMLPSMIVTYEKGEIDLRSGDMLVGYTDGISESMNPDDEEWSEESMLEFLKTLGTKPAAEILADTVVAADAFANGAKQHDDMTMIVVKVI